MCFNYDRAFVQPYSRRCVQSLDVCAVCTIRSAAFSTACRRQHGEATGAEYESGMFEPVTPDPLLAGNPSELQLLITVSASHTENSIRSRITLLADRQQRLKRQINAQIVGNTGGYLWKVRSLGFLQRGNQGSHDPGIFVAARVGPHFS